MKSNKVEICGVNTSTLPLLSREEKEELFVKIKAGDIEARETFINGNLRLVLSVIKRFYGRGENVQFSTYAVPMIIRRSKKVFKRQ